MAECAKGALDDAGLKRSDVDGLFGASMSMGLMGIVDLAEYLDLRPDYMDGTNIGGSSFVAHVTHAAAAFMPNPRVSLAQLNGCCKFDGDRNWGLWWP